jgi:antitoxin ParD1/3/4
MSEIERMTITLPAEMAAVVKGAVEAGDYASTSEVVVRAALRDWKMKRALQVEELAALNATRIVERGRKLLAARLPSV